MLNGQVSHWWHQIGLATPRTALSGNIQTDIAIVGGGYTGLWTAYYLKKQNPNLQIVILEQRFTGYGASGRNGGWLTNTVTGGAAQYVKKFGRATAERFQQLMTDTVAEVINITTAEEIDADLHLGGELNVAYTPAQEARLRLSVAEEQSWPGTDWQLLEAEEASNRVGVAKVRAAMWQPHAARIQPAKLVNELAAAVERLGVVIYENTPVTQIKTRQVHTNLGTVEAQYIVRATEGFTANLPGLHRQWLPMNSSLIVTEVLPEDVWRTIGWAEREVLGDFAHVYMYAQRTADDRIAIGGRGVPYRYGSRTDVDGQTPASTIAQLQRMLHQFFPATTSAQIDHAWSGVLGVPRDWSATVNFERTSGLAWAGGYVGTGVAASNLAGRTLADLICGNDSELSQMPWVNHRARNWEPEPLRWFATKTLYSAYGMADRIETRTGGDTSPIAMIADRITGR